MQLASENWHAMTGLQIAIPDGERNQDLTAPTSEADRRIHHAGPGLG